MTQQPAYRPWRPTVMRILWQTALALLLFLALVFPVWDLVKSLSPFLEGNKDALHPITRMLINWVYPQLEGQLNRFPADFFRTKILQVMYRASLAYWVFYVLVQVGITWPRSYAKARRYIWSGHIAQPSAAVVIVIFYLGSLFYTWDWYADLALYYDLKAFFKPILLLRLIGITQMPPYPVLMGAYMALVGLSLWLAFMRPYWSLALAYAILFIFIQGIFYSFEKIDHTYATLTYATMLMPLFIYGYRLHPIKGDVAFWRLVAIRLAVAGAYFLSGLDKELTTGFTWTRPVNLQHYLYLHETSLGMAVAGSRFWLALLAAGAIVFQIGFLLQLFMPRLWYVFIPVAVLFHWGTVWLLDVGSFTSSWIFCLMFFLPWEKWKFQFLRAPARQAGPAPK